LFISFLSAFRARSSAAHRDDDLEPIAVGERGHAMAAARHDLAVHLHRNALAREPERIDEMRDIGRALEATPFAVYLKLDHRKILETAVKNCNAILAPPFLPSRPRGETC